MFRKAGKLNHLQSFRAAPGTAVAQKKNLLRAA